MLRHRRNMKRDSGFRYEDVRPLVHDAQLSAKAEQDTDDDGIHIFDCSIHSVRHDMALWCCWRQSQIKPLIIEVYKA